MNSAVSSGSDVVTIANLDAHIDVMFTAGMIRLILDYASKHMRPQIWLVALTMYFQLWLLME